ncbi:hypothetical protein NT2_13_00585 [Caenibius tardaugens NBRC 16725]|uniref:Tlde1 domain-containing protein n=1 Tax=Caenibius tardaugens NBRC 16725 TaxID=1219035 RepID=U2YQK3_9SPHN|nr:DUF2778 domain-containing protein [Caenibius tardaugens NBRC 16725]GAD50972.1 hypothetical protein NT2_13_00585 [Caenibius tardaugens NBRC 16725]
MWRYEQSTGRFLRASRTGASLIATGYAGAKDCLNDPAKDHVRACGPIPKGYYRLRVFDHPRFKAPAIRCFPEPGTEMHGRSGFYIHGDNPAGDRSASSGCIILPSAIRQRIAALIPRDDVLQVVP